MFSLPLILDILLAFPFVKHCQNAPFVKLWALRASAWLTMFVFARRTRTHWPFSVLGVSAIIGYHLSPCESWVGTITGLASAYGVFFFQFSFFSYYTANWYEADPVAFKRRIKNLTPQQLTCCSPFAPPGALHKRKAGETPFWLQEFGDPSHEVLVLLSGMPCGNLGSGPLVTLLLLTKYFVALIEHPGAGCGRHEVFDLPALQKRVQQYVEQLQPTPGQPVFLHGVSGGANAAVYVASKMPSSVTAVVAVVGVAPGNTMCSMNKNRSVFWHPLSFKTKVESRVSCLPPAWCLLCGSVAAILCRLCVTIVDIELDCLYHNRDTRSQTRQYLPSPSPSHSNYRRPRSSLVI